MPLVSIMDEIQKTVETACQRSGWKASAVLEALGIPKATYYGWFRRCRQLGVRSSSMHASSVPKRIRIWRFKTRLRVTRNFQDLGVRKSPSSSETFQSKKAFRELHTPK